MNQPPSSRSVPSGDRDRSCPRPRSGLASPPPCNPRCGATLTRSSLAPLRLRSAPPSIGVCRPEPRSRTRTPRSRGAPGRPSLSRVVHGLLSVNGPIHGTALDDLTPRARGRACRRAPPRLDILSGQYVQLGLRRFHGSFFRAAARSLARDLRDGAGDLGAAGPLPTTAPVTGGSPALPPGPAKEGRAARAPRRRPRCIGHRRLSP